MMRKPKAPQHQNWVPSTATTEQQLSGKETVEEFLARGGTIEQCDHTASAWYRKLAEKFRDSNTSPD